MKIEHLAIWTCQLETLKSFYSRFFDAKPGEKYHNPHKQFSSYFLRFEDGCRLELMEMPGITGGQHGIQQLTGLSHFAVSTGSQQNVELLTRQLRQEGFTIAGEPRWTGDGYFESVVLDPDGNRVEITI